MTPKRFWGSTALIAALLLAVALAAGAAAQKKPATAEELLGAALHQEEVEGNLERAIATYKKVLAEAGGNRALAARALVQIGRCYEKLGSAEARKAYERVVRDFADQAEPVRVARERIAALQPGGANAGRTEMKLRRVWTAGAVDFGRVSSDGRFLSFTDWENDDSLTIHDFATGENRQLTGKGTTAASSPSAGGSVLSPDSKQIAYNCYNKDGFQELRIIGLDGSEPRLLYSNREQARRIEPAAWSPDGSHILAGFQKKDDTWEMTLVAVGDGSVRPLKPLDRGAARRARFSPDGRYIAYDTRGDIFLLETKTGRELPLVQHPANDYLLDWTPDGRILFSSDRSGTRDAWLIVVVDGKPMGLPELVKKGAGAWTLGFTRAGAYYYGSQGSAGDVYTAEIDLASGRLISPPQPASRRWVGISGIPDWSPDGKFLAYRGVGGIVIRSAETGEERELKPKLRSGRGYTDLRWAPDDKFLIMPGIDNEGRRGLMHVDVQTGDATLLVPLLERDTLVPRFDCSPDGKTIFYVSRDAAEGYDFTLFAWDLQTRRETALVRRRSLGPFSVSPDGRWLLLAAGEGEEQTQSQVLFIMPAAGGDLRELVRIDVEESNWMVTPLWTPDGRSVIFVKGARGKPSRQGTQLWRIPAEGGEPTRLDVTIDKLWRLRLHPDGRRIAFETYGIKSELWVLENFLPSLKSAAKQ
jgi:Tol biopolymer transport system component